MSLSEYVCNVGEIEIRKDQCFWIFPRECTSDKRNICSPWFSYMGETWRIITTRFDNNFLVCRFWRKPRCVLPKYKYSIQLKLRSVCRPGVLWFENTRENDPDYGCELVLKLSCRCSGVHSTNYIFSYNGLVKLIFDIQKKEKIRGALENGGKKDSNKVPKNYDESSDDEENSEDEESGEDVADGDNENTDKIKSSSVVGAKGIKNLVDNFKQIFLDGRLSDAVLKVSSREFNVHKVILVARSPVFASMFQHDLAEKHTNVVNIPDCTAESFEVFLHYLYSGRVETLSASNVYNVYYAADKYRVDDLKELCVKFMKMTLSVETFCDIIALSLRHGESKLQKAAIRFFCKNKTKIIKTVQWQQYMNENTTQANELLMKTLNL